MAYRTPSYRPGNSLPPLPEVDSTSTIESSISYHRRQKSNNPYRQGRDAEQQQSGDRKKTPTRAVFNDLSAAHLSITSGKVKTSGGGIGLNNKTSYQEAKGIPLQNLHPVDRSTDYFLHMPLPPLPAMIFDDLHGKSDEQGFHEIPLSDRIQTPQFLQPVGPGSSPSIFENIKTAFASLSSPLTRDEKPDSTSSIHWQNSSPSIDDKAKQYHSGLVPAKRGRDNKNATKMQQTSSEVRCPNNLDFTVPPGSSVYPSSPPFGDALHLPADSRRYTKGSHSLESAQRNGSRGRVYSLAGSRPSFLDQPYAQKGGEPSHCAEGSDAISVPDGSTVGNIYNHYLNSDPLDDFSDDDEAFDLSLPEFKPISPTEFDNRAATSNQARPSVLDQWVQLRTSRYNANPSSDPPQFALPKVPNSPPRHLAPSLTQGLGHSSSYGDTCNLLELTEQVNYPGQKTGLSRSQGYLDLRDGTIDTEISEPRQRFPPRSITNNPFGDTPRVMVDCVDESHVVYDDNDTNLNHPVTRRMPLEREVSEALRRASGFSAYSAGSVADSVIVRYRWFGHKVPSVPALPSRSIATFSKKQVDDMPLSASGESSDEKITANDPVDGFYYQGMIPQNWVQGNQQNVVRVPITRGVPKQGSSLHSPRHLARQAAVEDDKDDWETVGESAFGLDVEGGYIGGSIKRAGSSIANTSDDGSFLEIEDFGSTEHIAQHPVHPRYNAEYRKRDLKNTHIPVFAPVYREHKVNGYLADSSRIRPQLAPFGYAPPLTLGKAYPNPFKTPPPEVLPSKGFKAGSQFTSRKPNHFKPSLQTLCTESEDADHDDDDIVKPRPCLTEAERREWMEDFSKHKLTLGSDNGFSKSPSPTRPSRPSSWQRMMILAGDGALSNFNGSTMKDDEKTSDPKLRPFRLPVKVLIDDLTDRRAHSGKNAASKSRNPLAQGPLTASYRALRGKGEELKPGNDSEAQKTARRTSNKHNYPTNQLRPLSLLASQQPSTPSNSQSPSVTTTPNDFVYRSPLAPPKHKSWKRLYSPSQLRGIEEAAKADGFSDTPTTQRQSSFLSSNNTPEAGARKHLFETPTLRLWKRDDSTRTDLTKQKTRISIIVLCLCSLFPPLLLIYAFGGLDSIIIWWTNGRYSTYAKKQKRWALILMIGWSVVIFLGLVAFLVWWFSNLRAK